MSHAGVGKAEVGLGASGWWGWAGLETAPSYPLGAEVYGPGTLPAAPSFPPGLGARWLVAGLCVLGLPNVSSPIKTLFPQVTF